MENTQRIDISTSTWVDLTGSSVEGLITNCGESPIRYRVSDTQPTSGDTFGHILQPQEKTNYNLKSNQRVLALGFGHGSRVALTKNYQVPVLTKSIVSFADDNTVDAGGRMRVSIAHGIIESKNIHTQNSAQWEEVISGGILIVSATVGFIVGEEIRTATPVGFIGIGIIESITAPNTIKFKCNHNSFEAGATITGQTSAATATITSSDTGSNIYHNYDHASVKLRVGIVAGDYAIRQSTIPALYVPGKGQDGSYTFCGITRKAGVVFKVGSFNDQDGIFLEITETEVAIVLRTSTSGTASDANRILQSAWNIDRMDGGASGGPNPSGSTLDITKAQFIDIKYLWQGVGAVVVSLMAGNKIYPIHELSTANVSLIPYMRNPSLPLRYEIRNIANTASATEFEEICSTQSSEGGYTLPGSEFSTGREITYRTVTTTPVPIFAIRLKNEFPTGKPNRRLVKFTSLGAQSATNDAYLEMARVHDPFDITYVGGIPDWTPIDHDSGVEFSRNINGVQGRPIHIFTELYVPVGAGNKANSASKDPNVISLHSFIAQNFDSTNSQMFVVYARSFTGNSDVVCFIEHIESE